MNAVTYKEIFPLIAKNRLWLGYNSGHYWFKVPDSYENKNTDFKIDENGQKWRRMGNICWFTNVDIKKRHEDMLLFKNYKPDLYPEYDNYDAINVDRTIDIPCDYFGVMGVPITFLSQYNPDQFEIVAFRKGNDGKDLIYSFNDDIISSERETNCSSILQNICQKKEIVYDDVIRPILNGKKIYRRLTIRLQRQFHE